MLHEHAHALLTPMNTVLRSTPTTRARPALSALCAMLFLAQAGADPLPNTPPLQPLGDRSAALVEGVHRLTTRLAAYTADQRLMEWHPDLSSPEACVLSLNPLREKLREVIGAVDPRVPARINQSGPLLGQGRTFSHIRWNVLDGLHGDGIRIPAAAGHPAVLILIPDADTPPEEVLSHEGDPVRECLLRFRGEILIPRLLSRGCAFSGNRVTGIQTNCSHREWIYRQSFILGRHPAGLEVQKILALVDSIAGREGSPSVVLAGEGEGALIALFAAALDTRISAAIVSGYFGPREHIAHEPIDRNFFGLLRHFSDAELAAMVAPRPLFIRHTAFPVSRTQTPPAGARAVAAPGKLNAPGADESRAECLRAAAMLSALHPVWKPEFIEDSNARGFLSSLGSAFQPGDGTRARCDPFDARLLSEHQEQTVRDMEGFCQNLIPILEKRRTEAQKRMVPGDHPSQFYSGLEDRRAAFWRNVIGKVEEPFLPMEARSLLVRETDGVSIHEVEISAWKDVPAWGWLCVPKNLAPGERRPVVVCQHGLEGLPEHLVETDENSRAWHSYKAFALRLAKDGFITFAPHNLYRGKDAFRLLQRRLNPLGLSLFSIINGQHQRILEWLGSLPCVDPGRIGFYGLSYGGKTAMRTPAVLPGYALSICSGDFNEWIRKSASTTLAMSYVFVGEHEIWEWNLGGNANYAEMAALIAPRPFMVERGHRDGVGVDEWVNYEFAKVRRLYNQLGIGDRVSIEHFDGPHTIHGVGTFEFLQRHLLFTPSR